MQHTTRSDRRKAAIVRLVAGAPSPDMERHGAAVLAIALGTTTDPQLLEMAREVWNVMAAQRRAELEHRS
jgi:hypothetical protein